MVTIMNHNDVIVKRYGTFILGFLKALNRDRKCEVCGSHHETRALWLDSASVEKEMDPHEIQP